jgi:uncharacterized protein (TIGR01777 family)
LLPNRYCASVLASSAKEGSVRFAVTGATGFVGSQLVRALAAAGESVVALTRDPGRAEQRLPPGVTAAAWNGDAGCDAAILDGADVVVHLAGEPLAPGRWTPRKKAAIRDSRVAGTTALVTAMAEAPAPPPVLISASGVGYYGDCRAEPVAETSPPGSDFLATLCQDWEGAAARAGEFGTRVVCLRIGVVLGRAGALAQMTPIFRLGLGGPIGTGQQMMSWIHVDDLVALIRHAATSSSLASCVNAVAGATSNREFTAALGRALRRPAILPAPGFAVRLALGEFADVLLTGQRAVAAAADADGFAFQHTDLDAALADVLRE